LSTEQLDILRTNKLGKSRHKHIQNYVIDNILLRDIGMRTGKEVLATNKDDVRLKACKVKITREGGEPQVRPFSRRNVPLFEALFAEDEKLVKRAERRGIKAPGAEALLIKQNPSATCGDKDPNWRMETASILSVINRCRNI
jgi:hypothetical protein